MHGCGRQMFCSTTLFMLTKCIDNAKKCSASMKLGLGNPTYWPLKGNVHNLFRLPKFWSSKDIAPIGKIA